MSFYPEPDEIRAEERPDGRWAVAYRGGVEYAAMCIEPKSDPDRMAASDAMRASYADEQKAARRRQAQLDLYAERMVRASMLRAGRPSGEVQVVEARIASRDAEIASDMSGG